MPPRDDIASRVDALIDSAAAINARMESLTDQLADVTARLNELVTALVTLTATRTPLRPDVAEGSYLENSAPARREPWSEDGMAAAGPRLPTIVLPGAAFTAPTRRIRYQQLVDRIRDTIRRTVSGDSSVVVISKGDDDLLRLGSVHASHFPQTDNGIYAGYHPADSAAAIDHLEMVRAQGAEYLVVPSTAYWWFSHYTGFREYLETRYQTIVTNKDCSIYNLSAQVIDSATAADRSIEQRIR